MVYLCAQYISHSVDKILFLQRTQSLLASTSQPPAHSADSDLMDDVYSLHTEKEKIHQKEVKLLNARISELEAVNEELMRDKEKLQYNLSLLLV